MSSQTTYPFVPKACHCKLSEKLSTHPDIWWGYEMTKQKRFGRRSRYRCHKNDFECSAVPSRQTGLKLFLFTRQYDLLWSLIFDFTFKISFLFLLFFFLFRTPQYSEAFYLTVSAAKFCRYLFFYAQVPAIMAYFFVKKHSFSFHPFTHPLSPPAISGTHLPKLCEGTPSHFLRIPLESGEIKN